MSAEVLKTELVQVGQDSLQVVRQSGHGWVLIKAACEALGLDPVGQRQRLTKQPWAVACMTKATGSDGKTYEMFCLRSDKVAMWLATIDTSRLANDEARAKLVMWQCEAADVLDRWVRGEQGVAEHKTPAALPPGWSMRKLADIMDKVEQLREALDDYPVATVSSAEEVALPDRSHRQDPRRSAVAQLRKELDESRAKLRVMDDEYTELAALRSDLAAELFEVLRKYGFVPYE